jgi:hypothetical protein
MSDESIEHPQVLVLGPNGMTLAGGDTEQVEGGPNEGDRERPVTEMVEQPAKVMRIGNDPPAA